MKMMKKIVALMMALAMVLAMGTVFAGETGGESQTGTTTATTSYNLGNGASVTIDNILTVYNPDETSVYAPVVSYAFTIAGATATNDGVGVSVTDKDGIVGEVLSGAADTHKTSGDVEYTVTGTPTVTNPAAYTMDDTLNAAPNGDANNVKEATISFSDVTFSKPGVYRYILTRTVTDTNRVLTANTDSNTRYLDVYVKEETSNNTITRSIYGYILHEVKTAVGTSTTKSLGFYDEYHTSNLTVSKTLVNDATMNGNKFPFTVTFAAAKNAHIMVNAGTDGKAEAVAMDAGATSSAPGIAHQGTVKYIGIPNGFTATVTETNNVVGTAYNSVGVADNAAAALVINYGATSNEASTLAAADVTKTVAFTNTLALISPTGYVARIAPYALMLAAGIVLLVLFVKRRKPATEDDE